MTAEECEVVLLGREPIHGSANSAALAALVKSLMRKTDLHRRYVLRCHRDEGLQMIPYRRLEDEGFESDEDLTSLGSYEDNSSSIYVSDHAVRVTKCRTNGASTAVTAAGTATIVPTSAHAAAAASSTVVVKSLRTSSQSSSSTDATSGSVSSVGTDSANSSGASDNDDTDNSSLGHNVNHKLSTVTATQLGSAALSSSTSTTTTFGDKRGAVTAGVTTTTTSAANDDVECFAYHEIAFCHTDPSLPKVIVWVMKTKRQSKHAKNEYSYGLEAIVFLCHSEQTFRTLYKNFQEYSRRQKLEKPVRSRWKDEYHHRPSSLSSSSSSTTTTTTTTAAAVTAATLQMRHMVLHDTVASKTDTTKNVSSKMAANAAHLLASSSSSSSSSSSKSEHSNAVMYNLVQRIDTDGVTHIEVTRPVTDGRQLVARMLGDNEPSSIISINTPDSGDVLKTLPATQSDRLVIESVIRPADDDNDHNVDDAAAAAAAADGVPQPERPQRKKNVKNVVIAAAAAANAAHRQQQQQMTTNAAMPVGSASNHGEKVVKGQYVRVSVDPKTLLSSPAVACGGSSGWLFGDPKVTGVNMLAYPARLVWSRSGGDGDRKDAGNYHQHQHHHQQHLQSTTTMRHSRKMDGNGGGSGIECQQQQRHQHHRHRSKSNAVLRRGDSPKRYPMQHRYVDAIQINNSLPNRFFGRLKELTTGHHHSTNSKFRRRNSIGDITHTVANGIGGRSHGGVLVNYQPNEGKKFDKNRALAKSTPNLKSMIKNKNGKYCKDGYSDNEPKKVTFSAYATVQVVD